MTRLIGQSILESSADYRYFTIKKSNEYKFCIGKLYVYSSVEHPRIRSWHNLNLLLLLSNVYCKVYP